MTKDKDKKVPVLRFKGFTDDWEQRKLSQVFYVNGRIGFRGYTRKDITNKAQGGIWAISPINIRDNRLIFSHKNTYITKTKYDESPEIKLHSTYSLLVKTGSTLGKSAYVSELLEDDNNPLYGLIVEIVKTYVELSPTSQVVIKDFAKKLRENIKGKASASPSDSEDERD